MEKPAKSRRRSDDAALSQRELANGRPLRDAMPELAAFGRTRARKGEPVIVKAIKQYVEDMKQAAEESRKATGTK
jgi:hypothetical protein